MKSFSLLILFIFVFSLISFCKSEIDSLENIANDGKQDTGSVNALNLLSRMYWSSEEAKALFYRNKALLLAEKINYTKGIAQALNNLGVIYYNFSDYKKALEYHSKSLAIRKELMDKKDISISLNNIGNVYDGMSDYPNALDYFTRALELREQIDDKKGIANISNNIGNLHYSRGNYFRAIEYFFIALKIYEEDEEASAEAHANTLHNIGNVYKEQKENKNALEFYHKALKIRKEIEDEQGIGVSYNAIAALYFVSTEGEKNEIFIEDDYSKALAYFTLAIEVQEKINDKANMAISLNDMGMIYMELGNYEKAVEKSLSALRIGEEIGDKSTIAYSLESIAETYRKQNKNNLSVEFASKALALADSLSILDVMKTSHLTLSDNYASLKQFDKSFYHYKQHIACRDSLSNLENTKQIAKTQQKYELEKERLEEAHQLEKEEAEFDRKEHAQYLIIFTIVIIIILFVFIASQMHLSFKVIEFAAFVGMILLFQFLEVLLHPYVSKYTHGFPILFLLVNLILASGIKPLHHQLEKRLIKVSRAINQRKKRTQNEKNAFTDDQGKHEK